MSRRPRPGEFQRPERSQRLANRHLSGLGGVRLGTGMTFVGGLVAAGEFSLFLLREPFFPDSSAAFTAWAILGLSYLAAIVWVWARGGLLTAPMLLAFIPPVGVAVWLDLSSSYGLLPLGVLPTATMVLGALLMPLATLRRPSSLIIAAGIVAITLISWTAVQMRDVGLWAISPWVLIGWGLFPSVLAIFIVVLFRRLVRAQVDLAFIQSTVALPPQALGMFASERLTELDQEAEQLLARVGAGEPIDQATAAKAGELASELRVMLVEGRRDSWLGHAVRESEYLRDAIEIDDPDGTVALCDARSRDALLASLWILAGEKRLSSNPLHVRIRLSPGGRTLEIRLLASQIARHRISPTLWRTLDLVGSRTVRIRNRVLDIRVLHPIPAAHRD